MVTAGNDFFTHQSNGLLLYPRHTKYVVIPRHTKYVVIPPTYEVCGYTPDIRSMWGYNVFAFPSVRSYVRLFVRLVGCSFIRSSFHHRVKVFALKFIRPHILKTLWWISFIFGMMVHIGLKFLSAQFPPRGWPWGQGHRLRIFIK